MQLIKDSLIIEKKSKFYGYLYEIETSEDVKWVLNDLKEKHKNYRHAPHAYKLNNTAGKSNDKEPGEIGLSLLNILDKNSLNNNLLVVIRIYGGVKLGASNLLRTYSKTASLCINQNN